MQPLNKLHKLHNLYNSTRTLPSYEGRLFELLKKEGFFSEPGMIKAIESALEKKRFISDAHRVLFIFQRELYERSNGEIQCSEEIMSHAFHFFLKLLSFPDHKCLNYYSQKEYYCDDMYDGNKISPAISLEFSLHGLHFYTQKKGIDYSFLADVLRDGVELYKKILSNHCRYAGDRTKFLKLLPQLANLAEHDFETQDAYYKMGLYYIKSNNFLINSYLMQFILEENIHYEIKNEITSKLVELATDNRINQWDRSLTINQCSNILDFRRQGFEKIPDLFRSIVNQPEEPKELQHACIKNLIRHTLSGKDHPSVKETFDFIESIMQKNDPIGMYAKESLLDCAKGSNKNPFFIQLLPLWKKSFPQLKKGATNEAFHYFEEPLSPPYRDNKLKILIDHAKSACDFLDEAEGLIPADTAHFLKMIKSIINKIKINYSDEFCFEVNKMDYSDQEPLMYVLKKLGVEYIKVDQVEKVITLDKWLSDENIGLALDISKPFLSKKPVSQKTISALPQLLDNTSQITSLTLGGCEFGDTDFKQLAKSITRIKCLKVLKLNNLKVTNTRFNIIIQIITEVGERALESLSLCGNEFNDTSGEAIIRALDKCSTLKKLDLRRNPIENGTAFAIAQLLKSSKTLEELDIHSTLIQTEGVKALINGIEDNSSLKKILVGGGYQYRQVRIDKDTVQQLEDICKEKEIKVQYIDYISTMGWY